MKTFSQFFLFAAAILMAGSMVSCNDDTDDYVYEPLTQAEKTLQINAMKGSYQGVILFDLDYQTLGFTDSVSTAFHISAPDSVLVIQGFPLKVFAPGINDESLRKAFEDTVLSQFDLHLYLYRPWGTEGTLVNYFFNSIPYGSEELKVSTPMTIDGQSRNITMRFATNFRQLAYSSGSYSEKQLSFFIILESVVTDEGKTYDTSTIVAVAGHQR